jgi:hypothetical protein
MRYKAVAKKAGFREDKSGAEEGGHLPVPTPARSGLAPQLVLSAAGTGASGYQPWRESNLVSSSHYSTDAINMQDARLRFVSSAINMCFLDFRAVFSAV